MKSQSISRIHESDLVRPTLELLAGAKDGCLTIGQLTRQLAQRLHPAGVDAQILQDRNDTYFSQKVRNLVSHREQPGSPIALGLIEYIPNSSSLRITELGKKQIS